MFHVEHSETGYVGRSTKQSANDKDSRANWLAWAAAGNVLARLGGVHTLPKTPVGAAW